MLLAAGALSVIAFTALPSVASAGEPIATCFSTAGGVTTVKAECKGTITGTGNAILQDDSGKTEGEVKCTGTTGTATLTNGKSTGTGSFTFTGCKAFTFFNCTTPGAKNSGEIIINNLVSHLIYLHPIAGGATTDVGILITNVSTTFQCAGFVNKTVTGNVIGRVTNPECNKGVTHHTVIFGGSLGSRNTCRSQQLERNST